MNFGDERLPAHFWDNVIPEPNSGCWLWLGSATRGGYGCGTGLRRSGLAHRLVYELAVGKIPADLESDHLCRTTICCNPAHIELVTHLENVRRSASCQRRDTCKRGHEFTEENTYTFVRHDQTNPMRICRACDTARRAARYSTEEYKAQRRENYRLRVAARRAHVA